MLQIRYDGSLGLSGKMREWETQMEGKKIILLSDFLNPWSKGKRCIGMNWNMSYIRAEIKVKHAQILIKCGHCLVTEFIFSSFSAHLSFKQRKLPLFYPWDPWVIPLHDPLFCPIWKVWEKLNYKTKPLRTFFFFLSSVWLLFFLSPDYICSNYYISSHIKLLLSLSPLTLRNSFNSIQKTSSKI